MALRLHSSQINEKLLEDIIKKLFQLLNLVLAEVIFLNLPCLKPLSPFVVFMHNFLDQSHEKFA